MQKIESSIRCRDVIKIVKEIDRNIERLKLFGRDDPNNNLFEKDMIMKKLVLKLNIFKSLIDKGNLSPDTIDTYSTRISYIKSLTENEKLQTNQRYETTEFVQITQELNDEEITQRNQHIISLSENISQLNSMFNDLHSMIDQQGENIDMIEKKIDETNSTVQKGTEIIKDAETLQNRGFKARLIAGIFIVIATVGTIFKVS